MTAPDTPRPRPARRWLLAAVTVAALTVASGCGSDDDETVDAGEPGDTNDQPTENGSDDTVPAPVDPGGDDPHGDDPGGDDANGNDRDPALGLGAPLPEQISLGWLGLTMAEAEAKAEAEDRVLRVAREDDETFALTDDLGDGRANISLDDGIVTFVWIESIEGPMDREGAEDPADLVYVGLTEVEAEERGADEGHSVRVVSRDGEGLAVTMDYRPDRRNIDVMDGIVVAVTRG